MMQICLIPVSVVLCLIIISLFLPQIMEPYVTYDRNTINFDPSIVGKDYVDKQWYTPGGSLYYRTDGKILQHHQDVIDHRGHSKETKYVSDVLAGNDGHIPMIDEDDTGNEYVGPSNHTPSVSEKKEGFWYDMNRLEDADWYSGKLDAEFNNMVDKENGWRNELIKTNVKKRGWGKNPLGTDRIPLTVESFGNHRAPEGWNEVDYPIVTSNGLNMTPSFPQDGQTHGNIHKTMLIRKLWGEFDMLKQDDIFTKKITPRTSFSHIEKK